MNTRFVSVMTFVSIAEQYPSKSMGISANHYQFGLGSTTARRYDHVTLSHFLPRCRGVLDATPCGCTLENPDPQYCTSPVRIDVQFEPSIGLDSRLASDRRHELRNYSVTIPGIRPSGHSRNTNLKTDVQNYSLSSSVSAGSSSVTSGPALSTKARAWRIRHLTEPETSAIEDVFEIH
jgi:hypothetical protein